MSFYFKLSLILILLTGIFLSESYAQARLTIVFDSDAEETITLSEDDYLSFSDNYLIVTNNNNSRYIGFNSIRKLLVDEVVSDATNKESVDQEKAGLSVFPNPAQNYIYIEGYAEDGSAAEIWSITGKCIKSLSYSSGNPIDISDIASGVYIIKTNNQAIKFCKL